MTERARRWMIFKSGLPERNDSFVEGPPTMTDPDNPDEGVIEVVPASRVDELSAENERLREGQREASDYVDDALSALGAGYVPDEWSEDFAKALHAEADGARVALRQARVALHPTEETVAAPVADPSEDESGS